jgi:hypothetical protein
MMATSEGLEVEPVVARVPRVHSLQLASDLALAVTAAYAHVFDLETGDALWHPQA